MPFGVVGQLPEDGIAVFFIEASGLEAERIYPGIAASKRAPLLLGG
jgi:hypothetical protein